MRQLLANTLDFLSKKLTGLSASISDGYEGGKIVRRTQGWRPSQRTLDAHIHQDWDLLTSRGEWLGRNNPWCKGAKVTIADNILGTGLRTRSLVHTPDGGLDEAFNTKADQLYEQILEQLDMGGRQHFHQMTRTGLMSCVESGEVYYVERNDAEGFRSGERLIPLAFELVSGAQLDTSKDRPRSSVLNEIRRGVEIDSNGRRVAYYFFTDHPNDLNPLRVFDSERVPAPRVIPLFRQEGVDQVRGITWFAPVVTALWDLYEYQRCEINAAKVASYFIFLWKKEFPGDENAMSFADGDSTTQDLWGNPVEPLQPGIGLEGGPQDDLKVIQSSRPNADSVPWLKLLTQTMGVGLHCGYSKFTGDFAGKNFSSQRAEDLNDQRGFQPMRNWHAWYIDCEVRRRAIRQAIAFDLLPIPAGGITRFNRNPNRFLACKFIPPAQGYVEPRVDVAASFDRIRYGLSTWEDELLSQGKTIDTHEKLASELGISIEELRMALLSQITNVPGGSGGQVAGGGNSDSEAGGAE